ncbi:MAG: adenylyl-sulfate kinase [Proteobacteria bacterium]|nr:adenylyl-sulfate kinase [Pseudomonadota bacterium]
MKSNTAKKLDLATAERDQLKIVIVGHVDHGKSTLVGRLFHDTDSLPQGKYEQVKAACEKRGMPFEWSFLTDALQSERDQGITVDTTQIWFKTEKRDYVIIDAPGHKEFLKNMISGAANSEAALLIIDAKEGVKEQSKRHGYLLHLLGVNQIAVAVNKMDLIGYDHKRFLEIEEEYRAYLKGIGVTPTFIIPISGREGDHITDRSKNMPWYQGPTIVEALDLFKPKPVLDELPLRFPVQDVYKFDERRIIVGRIESGRLKVGDTILFSPTNRAVKVASIENWHSPAQTEVSAGMSVGITLEDQIFVERGNIASHIENAPILTNAFRARLFWLGKNTLRVGSRYTLKIANTEMQVEVKAVEKVIDTGSLASADSDQVERNSVAEIVLRTRGVAALDAFENNSVTGRFVLVENYHIVGGGIIDVEGFRDQRPAGRVKSTNISEVDYTIRPEHRAVQNGHLGGVLWFSGLSGSGKSSIAKELQRRLFDKGYHVYVLDGDNVRRGLNSDLGFTPAERSENIRRVGEVAALFADSGAIVITAFISPYKADRQRARVAAGDKFHGVYIKADIKTCEARDPKGLYKKARKGEIADFTGISAPFEEPENPDLVIDTAKSDIEQSVQALVDYIEKNLVEPVKEMTLSYRGSEI